MAAQLYVGKAGAHANDLGAREQLGNRASPKFVTTEDGTGLVHQAPAFGEDDMQVCRAYGLPFVNPVRPDGTFEPELDLVGCAFFKDADPIIVEDLKERGILFRKLDYEHSYPHCWRCHTALLYYAMPSWYIRTTKVKDKLIAENQDTAWHPDSIKNGRYGDWLNNNIDWALSRSRYWGTPLPIWTCECGHKHVIGSIEELKKLGKENFRRTIANFLCSAKTAILTDDQLKKCVKNRGLK